MKETVITIGMISGVFVIILLICAALQSSYQFEPEDAAPHIEELLGTNQYDITSQSNNALIIGSPNDVTYNLKLKETGETISCRCTSGLFQPLICRKYQ